MMEQTRILEHPDGFGITWIHPCALHGDDEGWYDTDEDYPTCQDCGCMIEVEWCSWCGANWMSFGGETGDDIIRSAGLSPYGDVMCSRCAADAEDEMESEETGDWEFETGIGN